MKWRVSSEIWLSIYSNQKLIFRNLRLSNLVVIAGSRLIRVNKPVWFVLVVQPCWVYCQESACTNYMTWVFFFIFCTMKLCPVFRVADWKGQGVPVLGVGKVSDWSCYRVISSGRHPNHSALLADLIIVYYKLQGWETVSSFKYFSDE